MARNIGTNLVEASQKSVVFPILMVEAEFDSGTTRLWSGVGDLQWNGETWTGSGSLLNIGSVEETMDIKANGTRVSLSGIPAEFISLALQENYQGRVLRIYLGAFEIDYSKLTKEDGEYVLKEDGDGIRFFTDTDIVASPIVIFSGRMDVMTIEESGGTSTIDISVENRLIDFERTRVRRYTNEDQKIYYPTDRGLEYVASIQDKEIVWGKV